MEKDPNVNIRLALASFKNELAYKNSSALVGGWRGVRRTAPRGSPLAPLFNLLDEVVEK